MSLEPVIWLVVGVVVALAAAGIWYRRRRRAFRRELEERDEALETLRRKHTKRVDRLRRERDRARETGHLDFVESLLPAIDDLRRASDELGGDEGASDAEAIREGLAMARRDIDKVLASHDIERIEPEGSESFDPELHEALRAADDTDVAAGSVVTCHRPGFRFEDRVLRPAAVTVAVDEDEDASEQPTEPSDDADRDEDATEQPIEPSDDADRDEDATEQPIEPSDDADGDEDVTEQPIEPSDDERTTDAGAPVRETATTSEGESSE